LGGAFFPPQPQHSSATHATATSAELPTNILFIASSRKTNDDSISPPARMASAFYGGREGLRRHVGYKFISRAERTPVQKKT
jgi:hypothetical protein